MYVRTELARAALHAAALTIDDPSIGDPQRATAGAKLLADEAATLNGRSCVQVHGGMGFTWEVPVHYFLKRAWVHATEFGTPDEQALAVADQV
jgi:alkylation response protein AidB-like acyl-CoA dehydrogenase